MTSRTPIATIVVPLLRQRDEWLRRAVESALAQTVAVEVLVITSVATPGSNLAVLDALQRTGVSAGTTLHVARRTRTGFPNALNTGIRLAATDRVGFLFSDDWIDRAAVEESAAIDADIVSSGATRHDAAGAVLPHLQRALNPGAFAARATLEQKASYLTHFFLFRRARLLEVGGLDETIGDAPGIDDYDLVWTLLERGAAVGLTPRPLYHSTIHDGERLTMRARDEQLRTLERIFDKHGFHGEARQRRLEEHARWFGRREDEVYEELRDPTRATRVPRPDPAPRR